MKTARGTAQLGFHKNPIVREYIVTVGNRYRVDPMNPAKLKHRGRIGIVESFDEDFQPSFAWMRCDGNNRVIKVELSDLVPAE